MHCRFTFRKMASSRKRLSQFIQASNHFSGLLVTLASDWVKLLFVLLSGFRSDSPVLVSNEVVWMITKFRLVITSGYFKIWCHTSLILITVPCRCFQFRFLSRSTCWTLSEVTCLILWNKFAHQIKLPSADVYTVY